VDELLRRFTTNLRALRAQKGWTQEVAADAVGTDPAVYSRLEGGKGNPTIRTITRVARAYGVDPIELLCREDLGER
jgi:transcriptional regulator with XRE-family HTH domain